MTPEFSRLVGAETISESPRQVDIEADETERRRLAGRFGLKAIDRLSANIRLGRRSGAIHADGQVRADVLQSCVVTNEPLRAHIVAPFSVRFVPDGHVPRLEEEFELSADDCDTLPLEANRIDVGELAAETLALAIDPFPRSKRADIALSETGFGDKADTGPFAALKALKDKLDSAD